MLRTIIASVALLCAMTAEAYPGQHRDCGVVFECRPSMSPEAVAESERVARGRFIANQMKFGAAIERRAVRAPKARQGAKREIPK